MKKKSELNQEYKKAFSEIRELLNDLDPMNLFPGSPEDEYDPEVEEILTGMIGCENSTKLTRMVLKVIYKWFSEELNQKELTKFCSELHEIKMKYVWLNK